LLFITVLPRISGAPPEFIITGGSIIPSQFTARKAIHHVQEVLNTDCGLRLKFRNWNDYKAQQKCKGYRYEKGIEGGSISAVFDLKFNT
jgi:hypothetical protein